MTFSLPANLFPPVGGIFFVSAPLSSIPAMRASDFVQALSATTIFYLDPTGLPLPVDAQELINNSSNTTFNFLILGGIGYFVTNGKTTNTPVVYSGNGWCNVFNPNDPGNPTPCP